MLDARTRAQLAGLQLAFRRARGAPGEGWRRGAGHAGRLEFADHREYEPGDDLRDLDWAIYARLERLFIKEYRRESHLPVSILLDASASMACGSPDKWRAARSLALALAWLALLGRHTVRLLLLGADGWLGPVDRPDRLEALAVPLAAAGAVAPAGPAVAVTRAARALALPGSYLLVSDLWAGSELQRALLSVLRPGRPWAVLHVLSGDELAPPLAGPVRLVDAESGARRELVADGPLLAAYHGLLEEHLGRWEGFCRRHRLGYARHDTRTPLLVALRRLLREDF